MKLTLKVENMEQEETWEAFYPLNDQRTSSTMSEPPVYFTRSSSVTSIQVSPSGTVIDRTRERETKEAKLKNNKT
jgi:hypothetical protein